MSTKRASIGERQRQQPWTKHAFTLFLRWSNPESQAILQVLERRLDFMPHVHIMSVESLRTRPAFLRVVPCLFIHPKVLDGGAIQHPQQQQALALARHHLTNPATPEHVARALVHACEQLEEFLRHAANRLEGSDITAYLQTLGEASVAGLPDPQRAQIQGRLQISGFKRTKRGTTGRLVLSDAKTLRPVAQGVARETSAIMRLQKFKLLLQDVTPDDGTQEMRIQHVADRRQQQETRTAEIQQQFAASGALSALSARTMLAQKSSTK